MPTIDQFALCPQSSRGRRGPVLARHHYAAQPTRRWNKVRTDDIAKGLVRLA